MSDMHEILFRGKRIDNGKWAIGFYFSHKDGRVEIWQPGEFILAGRDLGGCWHFVDHDTVGQYTGLTDKNGVRIFAGDIVQSGGLGYPTKPEELVYEVKYSTEWARFLAVLPNGVFNPRAFQDCEVIGNIHDNPELITR